MVRLVPIEEARKELGRLIDEIRQTGKPLFLTRRGADEAVLLSRQDYERLKEIEEAYSRMLFEKALASISDRVGKEELQEAVIEEAIRFVRGSQ